MTSILATVVAGTCGSAESPEEAALDSGRALE